MPSPEGSDPGDPSQSPGLETQADFDAAFEGVTAGLENQPGQPPEASQPPEARAGASASGHDSEVPALRRMRQSARDRVRAAYPDAPGPRETPRVPRHTEVDKLAKIAAINEAADTRLASATVLMQEAAQDPTKLTALYERGRSDDPEDRAQAAIALSGVKLERRAARAEKMNAGVARASAASLRDLRVANTNEQMRSAVGYGGDVPRVPKRRFWQFWKP
jgi:hypothetical protein